MANISSLLNTIKNAIYGRDMRSALHDSIKAVNDDTETRLSRNGGTMTGGITMNGNKITSSATPSTDNDYTNKKYVDAKDTAVLSYSNSDYPDCTTTKLAIDKLFEKVDYIEPVITSLTMSPSTTVYEIGHTIAVNALTFSWVLNKSVTSIVFDGTSLSTSLRTTKNTAIVSSNKTFTLTVSDGQKTTSKSLSISFQPKIYYGSSNKTSGFDSAFVLGLANSRLCSSRVGSFTMTAGSDEYAYICIPARYGTPSVKIGGFDTELISAGTISNKNASGYTESYNIYRTGQKNLGTITMVIT